MDREPHGERGDDLFPPAVCGDWWDAGMTWHLSRLSMSGSQGMGNLWNPKPRLERHLAVAARTMTKTPSARITETYRILPNLCRTRI